MAVSTTNIDHVVSSNEKYAASVSAADKALPLPPAKKYAIVTCIDARLHPTSAFGLSLGNAHVMRNAGGSARDALRSLVVSQKLLGTEEIIVVKHTDCGMLTFTNEDLYALLGEKEAEEAKAVIGDFLPFPELRKAVREDVEFLRGTGLVRNDKVSGWIYDVRTAKVERII